MSHAPLKKNKVIQQIALTLALLLPLPADPVSAEEQGVDKIIGVGPILGEPTGATVKLVLNEKFAIQASLALVFWHRDHFALFIDFIWYPHELTDTPHFLLMWYFGGGVGLGLMAPWDYPETEDYLPAIYLRVPFGISFFFKEVPVEAFVEIGPSIKVYPEWDFGPFIAIGGRWYFGLDDDAASETEPDLQPISDAEETP